MAGYGGPVALDTSAWVRARAARLKGRALERWSSAVREGEIVMTPAITLQILYSAFDGAAFTALREELDAFPVAPGTRETFELAASAQRRLAASSSVSHRVKPVDLITAAVAHQQGIGVLHYDKDFDTIARHSGLSFSSVWIARRGSVA